jgi:hypothetical protein
VWAYLFLDFRVVVVWDVTYPLPKRDGIASRDASIGLGATFPQIRTYIIYLEEVCKAEIK